MQVAVKACLEKFPEYRDDDKQLVSYIWWVQLKKNGINSDSISATKFLLLYGNGDLLPQADVITRARRKVQEENKHLRGNSYDERHEQQKRVRKDI